MSITPKILCRDINGYVHIVSKSELIQRKSVYGVIETQKGYLLVRDCTRTDDKWDLLGGGINPGENILDALNREIKEETNLDMDSVPQKICQFIECFYDVESDKGWESTRYFYLVAASGAPRMDGNQIDVIKLRNFMEPLSSTVVAPVAREVIKLAIEM